MKYDFKSARERVEKLKIMYRRLAQIQEKDGSWDWWIEKEVGELEEEIKQAHKKKKTA